MPTFWSKLKTFLCCGEEEDPPVVIGEPFDFKRVEVELAGLSEHERSLIRNRPVPVTYPLNSGDTQHAARLDRARAHSRALSNSVKSVTTAAMSTVGAKGSGYFALANESSSMMQPLNSEDANSNEMKQLLPHLTSGPETNSSLETATAGCEEDDDDGRSFVGIK
ncbi:hypothetical protein KCU86_g14924, partial [Aureobasidium melanogenum]